MACVDLCMDNRHKVFDTLFASGFLWLWPLIQPICGWESKGYVFFVAPQSSYVLALFGALSPEITSKISRFPRSNSLAAFGVSENIRHC